MRKDLPIGLQLAQSCHVVFSFSQEHSLETKLWMEKSNYICCLAASDENELYQLIDSAEQNNIRFSVFKEPDIGDQITAVALAPGPSTKKLCSNLKLALKNQ